ncbi:hypothetical protein DFH09DRAFT_1472421 [Mycena vulgaris]|nr:hypothetical protein DFH09DRAFT_1472421 [Mycena vulgaris]
MLLQHHALGLGLSFYGPQSVGATRRRAQLRAIDWFLFPLAYFVTSILSILGALLNVTGTLPSSQVLDNVGFALLACSGWIDVALFVVARNTLIVRRTGAGTAANGMNGMGRSGIHATTHHTTFLDLDPADLQHELQQRSGSAHPKAGAEDEFEG